MPLKLPFKIYSISRVSSFQDSNDLLVFNTSEGRFTSYDSIIFYFEIVNTMFDHFRKLNNKEKISIIVAICQYYATEFTLNISIYTIFNNLRAEDLLLLPCVESILKRKV